MARGQPRASIFATPVRAARGASGAGGGPAGLPGAGRSWRERARAGELASRRWLGIVEASPGTRSASVSQSGAFWLNMLRFTTHRGSARLGGGVCSSGSSSASAGPHTLLSAPSGYPQCRAALQMRMGAVVDVAAVQRAVGAARGAGTGLGCALTICGLRMHVGPPRAKVSAGMCVSL